MNIRIEKREVEESRVYHKISFSGARVGKNRK